MEDDTKREDIACRCVSLNGIGRLDLQDLGSHVSGCSTSSVEIFGATAVFSQAKVNNDRDDPTTLDLISFDHDVFQLEVSMHDAFFMKIAHSLEKVNHDDFCLLEVGKPTFL